MNPTELLTTKAATLARAAPNEWREFTEAFVTYSASMRDQLVQSPLAELPTNQGKAMSVDALVRLFAQCLDTADKIARKAQK